MSAQATEYIAFARQLSTNGCYGKAVDLYIMAFEKNAQLIPQCEQEFRSSMTKLNEVLAADRKIADIFENFSRAIRIYPGNIYLINEIGSYLYKFGYYREAWKQFKIALEVDAGYVRAEKNFNSLRNIMVERWHFRMLNDTTRNNAYRTALHEIVQPSKSTVLDLGTGTGLLAMYASECNPLHIAACDSSEIMISVAGCVLKDNKLHLSIALVNKLSTHMNHTDIGGKHSLLVTELFDAGLFGENILQSLSHAWQNLLTKSAQIIPRSAQFFVMGVHSNRLSARYQLQHNAKSLLNIEKHHTAILSSDENYDCEDVHLYPDIKYMTEAEVVVGVDFTNFDDIQKKIERAEPYSVELQALESGEINAIVGWFKLDLTSNVTITTDPRIKTRANAWQQAVFFDSMPRNVDENERFKVDFCLDSGKLVNKSKNIHDKMRISPEMLRFLNDTDYIKKIKSCIGMAYVYLGQMTEISDVKVVDFSPFPVFGMFMVKRGIHSLVCYAKTEGDREFLEAVFTLNGAPLSRITLITGDEWKLEESFGHDKYHAIFCNIFELCGDLDIRWKDIAENLRNTHLIQGGLFMPSNVTLIAQIVSSNWLDINNRVHDDNVGYKVSANINKFQVSQYFYLDFTDLEYTPLSDPIALGNCNHLSSEVFNVTIKNDGDANAILCWYNIELMESLAEISTKRPNSFIEGTAFMANPIIPMAKGNIANIICCVDPDGAYKLIMDLEKA